MSNDKFSDFSQAFTAEFGRALTNAWQEALTNSLSKSFGGGSAPSATDAGNGVFSLWQNFFANFPGGNLGTGKEYLEFGQFIKPYMEFFAAGASTDTVSAQMSQAFRDAAAAGFDKGLMNWFSAVPQLCSSNGLVEILETLSKSFMGQQGLFSADLWPGFQPSPAPP
ncbi:MAG: hypothetical protein AAF387_05640, partial [Pseudomonadota bacterium]